jgi:hypothetical protein
MMFSLFRLVRYRPSFFSRHPVGEPIEPSAWISFHLEARLRSTYLSRMSRCCGHHDQRKFDSSLYSERSSATHLSSFLLEVHIFSELTASSILANCRPMAARP